MTPPRRVGIAITTGTAAPSTQITWKRDSNRANDRPRLASGASRCTTASNACLPEDAAMAIISANIAWPGSPSNSSPQSPPTPAAATAPSSRYSSSTLRRMIGAIAAPSSPPMPVRATTTPKCQTGGAPSGTSSPRSTVAPGMATARPVTDPSAGVVSAPRNAKASRNVTNPTTHRNVPIADEAESTPALRSSARSSAPSGVAATVVTGTRNDATAAAAKTSAHSSATAPGENNHSSSAPGRPAANAARPDSSCSFELASTRAWSPCTTVGTIAALATEYDLARTSMAKASGNSSRLSDPTLEIISSATRQRPTVEPISIQRRPPFARSMAGPMNGPTTANGAIVNSRYSAMRQRAPAGSSEKNSEPASTSATRASPPVANTWVSASRPNGVEVSIPAPRPVRRAAARRGGGAPDITAPSYGRAPTR